MNIVIREAEEKDLPAMTAIWNEVVREGNYFPLLDAWEEKEAGEFFARQSFNAVAEDADSGEVLGLYTVHPNSIGRCGHVANASYAVAARAREQHIGAALVAHSLDKARELGFRLMQFNGVVANNHRAIHLYEKLGFRRIGTVPGGFLLPDGRYEDVILFYHTL